MTFNIQFVRGLWKPAIHTYHLKNAEELKGLWKRIVLLILASGLIFGISAYFGIGSEYISAKMTDLKSEEYEMHKALYVAGQVLWGLVYAALVLYIPAIIFWTLTDLDMGKLIAIQVMVLAILLVEKLLMILLNLAAGLAEVSSPLSLGVIGQYLTSNDLFIYFLASITLFKIWTLVVQFQYLKVLSEKNSKIVLAIVIGINLSFWLLAALLSVIQLEKVI